MKKDIHPTTHPVVFVDTSCGAEFITRSTLTSDKTKNIDGVEHQIINVEISSASHPFYTGKQILVDTARRVEKFEERMKKSQNLSKTKKAKKEKVVEKVKSENNENETEETKTEK
jgi:large subunit ribosomal protein L31